VVSFIPPWASAESWEKIMIRNGLYSISTKMLDGAVGGATGISVLRNGKMLGGGSVLYHFGSYHCSDGKW
jgi:hypothetical protein